MPFFQLYSGKFYTILSLRSKNFLGTRILNKFFMLYFSLRNLVYKDLRNVTNFSSVFFLTYHVFAYSSFEHYYHNVPRSIAVRTNSRKRPMSPNSAASQPDFSLAGLLKQNLHTESMNFKNGSTVSFITLIMALMVLPR